MTRAGGPSTVAGITFQAFAIARSILDVYLDKYDSIRAEVPPHADVGQAGIVPVCVDDYVIQHGETRIYHQAKSKAPRGGTWTIDKLGQEEILQKFIKQLKADPSSECHLVTASDCQLLGEIADRAREAKTLGEFTANLSSDFQKLTDHACRKFDLDNTELYKLLLRIKLEIRTPEQFRQELNSLSLIHFADSMVALDCLSMLAMKSMEMSQVLDHPTIEAYLSERNVFAKPKATQAELLDAVRNASSRLRTVGKDIGGVHIQQSAIDKLLEWIEKPDIEKASVAALLDQAGSGKTVALSMLLRRLEEAGFVVLGIKVDSLAFSSQEELASAVGLPDSIPSVLQYLQTTGHRIVLLIDQVDALSSAMSRESSSIAAVLDLVARTAGLRIPIVLACRSFDWKYDYRLRPLREGHPAEFALPELTDDQLMQVLSACSLKLSDLNPLTIKVIRCPLRLKVFFEVVQAKRQVEPLWMPGNAIYALQTLYQDFWDLKKSKADSDGITARECEIVSNLLAQRMHDDQHLSAPEAIISDHDIVRRWLISEDILCLHGKVLSFFHQTFFDFIFARQFVCNSQSLINHLLDSDQGLFFRPMVRQILEYLRDVDYRRYLLELEQIIRNPLIRNHLRWIAVIWLGQNRDPKPEELSLLEPMLSKDDTRSQVLKYISGNSPWFDLLT
jgi:hypothetical protein